MCLLDIFRGQHCLREKFNVAVAAYVTIQARIKHFKGLSKLRESVLYCDTKLAIFIQKSNQRII